MPNEHNIIHNESTQRFEMPVAGETAYIQYRIQDDILSLYYILVPLPSRGQGLSRILIQYALDFARERQLKIKIYCPFMARYLAIHPEMEYEKA